MSTNSNLGILLAVVGVGAVGLSILRAQLGGMGGGIGGKFKAKRLLSANELEFIGRLESAAPELRFHAQVATSSS